jgi:L-asparaginase II
VFVKSGAEGVYCPALPAQGLGIALKIDDGNTARGAESAMAAAIEALHPIDDADRTFLRGLSEPALRNWNGLDVGSIRPTAALKTAFR